MTSTLRRHEQALPAVPRPDLLARLDREHRQLVRDVDAVFRASGAARHEAMQRLRVRLRAHLAGEHAVLDPLVRDRLDGGRHVLATLRGHEQAMAMQLRRLEALGDYAGDYCDVLTCFETHLLAHVAIADVDLHPALRDVTSPAERATLAGDLHARPAVSRPSGATGLLRLVGPLALPLSVLRVLL